MGRLFDGQEFSAINRRADKVYFAAHKIGVAKSFCALQYQG
jgi:hypothetical protein